ncbi:MAG: hypothetical protein AB2806_01135, partial [Candidatus Thiodiazotropha sp.]
MIDCPATLRVWSNEEFESNPPYPPYKKGPYRAPFYMAEREGFEPSMELLTPYSLSRGAPS